MLNDNRHVDQLAAQAAADQNLGHSRKWDQVKPERQSIQPIHFS